MLEKICLVTNLMMQDRTFFLAKFLVGVKDSRGGG